MTYEKFHEQSRSTFKSTIHTNFKRPFLSHKSKQTTLLKQLLLNDKTNRNHEKTSSYIIPSSKNITCKFSPVLFQASHLPVGINTIL